MEVQGFVVKRIKVDGKSKIEEDEVWSNARSFRVDENNNLWLYDEMQEFLYMFHNYNYSGIGKWPTDE